METLKKAIFAIAIIIAVFDVWLGFKVTKRWYVSIPVQPEITFPTAIVPSGTLYDYCHLDESSSPENKLNAGTPIPYKPVFTGSTPTPTAEVVQEQAIVFPTEIATETAATATILPTEIPPTPIPPTDTPIVKIVKAGSFRTVSYHFVIVGVGYDENENETALITLISKFQKKFEGVNVDFAYLKTPYDIKFKHVGARVEFVNLNDKERLIEKIKSEYPMDGMVIALKTTDMVGTGVLGGDYSILSSNSPYSPFIFTHEMGHMLGMDDQYARYMKASEFPNIELFYLDAMPPRLRNALNELGYVPPLYVAGTCNGKYLYTFYDTMQNIYGNVQVGALPPEYFEKLEFTKLQIIEMNNFISNE